jgi:HSP20 family protein
MKKQDRPFSFPIGFSDEVDRLFEEIINRPWGISPQFVRWNPSLDLSETPEDFILEVDLPGVKREHVEVEVEGTVLILKGSRSFEESRDPGRFHYQERCFGSFLRRLALPESVDKEGIEASFHEGVLRVILPKKKPKERRR